MSRETIRVGDLVRLRPEIASWWSDHERTLFLVVKIGDPGVDDRLWLYPSIGTMFVFSDDLIMVHRGGDRDS